MSEQPADQRQADIDQIAKALRQVVSCNPQLLFRAAMKVSSDLFFDSVKADFEGKPAKVDAYRFRAALCQLIGGTLIRSGRAELEMDDVANMALVMRLNRESQEQDVTP